MAINPFVPPASGFLLSWLAIAALVYAAWRLPAQGFRPRKGTGAGLDSDSEVFVLEALHKLAVAGKTLIFSTHHQALLTLANRVLLVSGGEVRDA